MSKLKKSSSKPRLPPIDKAGKRLKLSELVDVHLVSESTGSLARHMVSVAMSQFPKLDYELHDHPFCASSEKLRDVRSQIEQSEVPLVFAALTNGRLKRSLATWCERRQIDHWELVQPLVDFIANRTGHRSVRDASRAHRCNDDYFKRIDALEFTLQHDDSRRLESVGLADIILIGVSRVGKTPISACLGSMGYRAANISIAREVKLPKEVIEYSDKAVGLTIDPDRLAAIRKRRFQLNRLANTRASHVYFSPKEAFDDILFAEDQFRRLRIPALDVTDLTVEESAVRILELFSPK